MVLSILIICDLFDLDIVTDSESVGDHSLVETHIFSFVVGRAFVTDIEKLKISSKTRSLDAAEVLRFFTQVTKVCLSYNLSLNVDYLNH